MRRHGITVHVCTALRPHHLCDSEEWNSIHILRFPDCVDESHHRERELILAKALGLIRGMDPGKGCIQPNGETWRTTFALARARMMGIPSTFYFSMFPPESDLRGWAKLRARLRISLCLLPFRRLVFCSRALSRAYGSLGCIRAGRMALVPNGVDLERFRPPGNTGEKEAERRQLGLPEKGLMILYVGGFMPRKGCDLLLEAWARAESLHPDAFLVCVGSQGMRQTFRDPELQREMGDFQSSMAGLAERLESRGRLNMAGEVNNVDAYYRAADVFVFPSRREGLPNAVLEAMASGLPCLLAPFHGFPESGEEFGAAGNEFLRVPHDADSWVAAISEILGDAGRRAELGQNARRLMERTQGWDATVAGLANTYLGLMGGDK
ncbi:glycosyltransferase family 4 protein [Akkermansiaceae bacterium]|nr:glycosyltransferase family 4 protein [Akkermansiaceae bacterium]